MTIERRTLKKTQYYYILPETDSREPIARFKSLDTAAVVLRYLNRCEMPAEEQLEARAALKAIDNKEE